MRKTLVSIITALAVVFLGSVCVKAVDLSALPPDLANDIENLLATRFPPELHGVTFDPETPVAGEPTAVTVSIYNPADVTDDETSEAYILYTTDGGASWSSVTLESEDSKKWTGELPAFDSGTEVTYAIRALDNSINEFTSVPCMVTAEEVTPAKLLEGDCVRASEDLSACEDPLPRGCFMRMSTDDEPLNDDEETIPEYGDLVDYRIGYDENNIYMDLTVETEIDGGTMTPTDVHLYGAAIINADKIGTDTSIDALLSAGGVILYSPPLKQFESTGMVSDCFFGFQKGGTFAIDSKKIKCFAKENHLLFKISKELLTQIGENESGIYQFLELTGQITDVSDFSNIKGRRLDLSHVTSAQFTTANTFTVE